MPTEPNLILFFGRLHPLLVHLPIGFLTLLALVEVLSRFKKFKGAADARGIILFATVASVIITIACGLMLSTAGGYDSSLLFWHKWMGITLGIGIIVTAWAFWKSRLKLYNTVLIATLLLLGPASHFGGSMTHGKNYLMAYAPQWMRGHQEQVLAVAGPQPQTASQAMVYNDLVRPVLQQNCLACHGPDKSSGDLRLDSLDAIHKGGTSGPLLVANNSGGSLIIQRLQLAAADAKHMPPDGKPQPSDDQIDLLKWWIDNGAPSDKHVVDLNPTDDQLAMVTRLLKLPEPVEPGAIPPLAVADAQSQISTLSPKIGIVCTPVAVDQPWVIVNASMNRSFGDDQLKQLSALSPNIVDLNLAGTHVTDAGLATVGSMTNLTRLRLDRTSVTDAGLAQLTHLKKLSYLNLYSTSITNKGLTPLSALPNLRHLYLFQTKVDPTAAAQFAAAKTDASKMEKLKKQIAALQEQLSATSVDVVEGIKPTTKPVVK